MQSKIESTVKTWEQLLHLCEDYIEKDENKHLFLSKEIYTEHPDFNKQWEDMQNEWNSILNELHYAHAMESLLAPLGCAPAECFSASTISIDSYDIKCALLEIDKEKAEARRQEMFEQEWEEERFF